MVRSLFNLAGKEVRGMHQAAYLLAVFALGSQVLALVRDRLFATTFGASHTLDVYYGAFRIPDFLFATVASLLSLYALLPILSELEKKSEGMMVGFLRQVLLIFFVAMGAVSLVVYIFAPQLVAWVTPGIASPDLVLLVRILLLQPIFLGASNILASLTQLRHKFFLYSISPLLYNLGIIFGIIFLYPSFGIAGLGWGVVIGAALHMMVQVPFFVREKGDSWLLMRPLYYKLRGVLALSVPRTLALSAGQLSSLVLIAMASYLSAGSISIFTFAFNLQAVPLTIIGVSYSVAAFPTLARLHAQGQQSEFLKYIETALRHIFFWTIPTMIFVIVLRAHIVRIILGTGAFGWGATRLTAAALALFMLSLVAQSLTLLIARAYYAAGNTHKPLYFGMIQVLVSISSSVLFVYIFQSSFFVRVLIESLLRVSDVPGTTVLMLAFGYAVGSLAQFGIGFFFFLKDFGISGRRIHALVFQSFSASVIGSGATYSVLALTGTIGEVHTTVELVLQGVNAGVVGLTVTAFVLWLLGNEELTEALSACGRRFRDAPRVTLETTDLSSK